MTKPNLVAYYSMTGNTRRIVDEVVGALHADAEEIREPHPRHGLGGVLRALFDAITRREPPIEPGRYDPADYDLLVLSGPIWAGRLAAPVRSYARQHAGKARRIAFVCTEGGRGGEQAFAELSSLCGRTPDATLEVTAEQIRNASYREAVQRFASSLPPMKAAG
ncbi:flavodoxin family protein [Rhodanobacter ginsengisoli]|uniref:Flavodoxin family protein n=1 Tax=Rhodanobacter ginsengisoli TaxID=418646 RepID=A0ABW0QKW9_9GAMM